MFLLVAVLPLLRKEKKEKKRITWKSGPYRLILIERASDVFGRGSGGGS